MQRLIVGLSLAVLGWAGLSPARACDHPGTPDQVTAVPVSPTSINLFWRNTTGRAGGSQDMWFDIAVTDGAGHFYNPSLNITGGAGVRGIKYGQISSHAFNGLIPGREYHFQMRARDGSGTGGCVSEQGSNIAVAWTPTPQIDAKCAPYATTAMQQVQRMKAHGPITVACNVISGPRWNPDRSAHYVACTEMVRNHQPDFTAGETAARSDTINKCTPTPGQCTRDFVEWRKGNDNVPIDWCLDVMGVQCASGSFLALAYPATGGRAMICVPNSKKDSVGEQVEHIARGVAEGAQDAFVAAAPFLGPATEGLACANGIVYACAVLALDIGQVVAGKRVVRQVAGVAADAITIAAQAQNCANGDAGACAQLGVRAAARAGLNIPGKNAAQIATAAQGCNARDNNACIELGTQVVDAAGLKTTSVATAAAPPVVRPTGAPEIKPVRPTGRPETAPGPVAAAPAQIDRSFMVGTDLPGSDYRNTALNDNNASSCKTMCTTDAKCVAWTWVKPGVQNAKAMCWLKNAVPPSHSNPDVTSGIKVN